MKKTGNLLKQAGMTLLEGLLFLSIMAILLVMAMQYFSTASDNQKMNMVRTFVGADMAAFQSYGINNSGDYTGLKSWSTLVDGGYLNTDPKNMKSCTGTGSTDCTQVTPWGQDVSIGEGGTTISVPLPNKALCTNLQQSYGAGTVTVCSDDGAATINMIGGTS